MENKEALGLDGCLGNYPAKIDIQLKEVSRPFRSQHFQSPANRAVMDKQIDKWIQMEVN